MRKILLLPTTGLILFASSLLWAASATSFTATPSAITFTANNPGGTVTANQTATVQFTISSSSNNSTWTLSAGTAATSFTGCTTVPASAITVKCLSAANTGGGQGNAACNATAFTTLPSTLPGLQVASGKQGNQTPIVTVTLNYQIADSWKYVANICPLTVTYTAAFQ
jgi:hypothetical protein